MKDKKHTKESKKKISKALEGNKNAEVWTEEATLEMLDKMIEYATTDIVCEVIKKTKTIQSDNGDTTSVEKHTITKRPTTLLSVASKFRMLSDWFNVMAKKHSNNETVLRTLLVLKEIVRTNLIEATENGTIKTAVGLANLSHNHGWTTQRTETNVVDVLKNVEIIDDADS